MLWSRNEINLGGGGGEGGKVRSVAPFRFGMILGQVFDHKMNMHEVISIAIIQLFLPHAAGLLTIGISKTAQVLRSYNITICYHDCMGARIKPLNI